MKSYATLSEAVEGLKKQGYTQDFNLLENCIECGAHPHQMKHDEFKIDTFFRFEGNTDPSDECIVYAISSDKYHLKGTLVNGYGLSSNPLADEMIKKLKVH